MGESSNHIINEEGLRLFIAATSNRVYRMSANWERMENLVGAAFAADTSGPMTGWMDKYILPEDQPQLHTAIQKAIAAKAVFELEHRVIQADGSIGWVHSRAVPILNEQGEIAEWFGTGTDITERRKTADAILRKSEEKYRSGKTQVAEELSDTKILHLLSKTVTEENKVIEENKIAEENKVIEEKTIGIYKQILEAAIQILHSDMGSIQMYDPVKDELLLKWQVNFHPESAAFWQAVNAGSSSTCGIALAKGERIVITDVDNVPILKGTEDLYYYQLSGIKAVQSTPVVSRSGKILGMFSNHWKQPYQPSEQKLHLLDVLARQAADVIDRKLAEDALLRNRVQLAQELKDSKKLQEISTHLIEEDNITALYTALLNAATDIMEADCATIQLLIPEKNELYLLAHKGIHPLSAKHFEYVGTDALSSYTQALTSGKRFIITDLQSHAAALSKKDGESYRLSGIVAMQSPPLITRGGKRVGMISTHWKQVHAPLDRQLNLFDVLARQAADLIERKKADDALYESESQLRLLLIIRDEFIGIASHELNTPITSLKVYGEIVQERMEQLGNKADIDLLAKLNAQIDRLSSLVGTLLDTTRIAEGRLPLQFEQLDLNNLVRERAEEIGRTSTHTIDLQQQSVPTVNADRERIGQVITNLLSNAIKYSPKGTTITILTAPEGNFVKVSVQDHGFGIPKEDLEKIFERFFRVTANNMDTYPGMGLGLYITAQIIERHGGAISVQSQLGEGTTFSFTLPLKNNEL